MRYKFILFIFIFRPTKLWVLFDSRKDEIVKSFLFFFCLGDEHMVFVSAHAVSKLPEISFVASDECRLLTKEIEKGKK